MYATRRQSDDGTLCGLGFSFQATQSTGGGLQEAIPGYRGATPGGFMEKILRTFSWPVLNDDVINCPLGYVASVRATRKLSLHKTSRKSKHESLERGSITQLGVFRVNQHLI